MSSKKEEVEGVDIISPSERVMVQASTAASSVYIRTLRHLSTHIQKKRGSRSWAAGFAGLVYLRQGNYIAAASSFENALKEVTTTEKTYAGDHLTAEREARYSNLLALCQARLLRCVDKKGISDEDLDKDVDEIQKRFVHATKLDNAQADVWNNMGRMFLQLNRFEGAKTVYTNIIASFPQYVDALNNLGLAFLGTGDSASATKQFQQVLLKDRGHTEALSNYAAVLLQQGYTDYALRLLQQAFRHEPSSSYVWNNAALAFLRSDDPVAAERLLRHRLRELEPRKTAFITVDDILRMNLANFYCRRNQISKGRDVLAPLLRLARHSENGEVNSDDELSDISGDEEDEPVSKSRKVASSRHERSVREGGGFRNTERWMQSFFWLCASPALPPDQVESALVTALENNEKDWRVWLRLGVVSLTFGSYEQAHECFKHGLFYKQGDNSCEGQIYVPGWLNLGLATHLLGKSQDAAEIYHQALKGVEEQNEGTNSSPFTSHTASLSKKRVSVAICNNLATLLREEGHFEKSEKLYNQALELIPDHAPTLNNLALLMIRKDNCLKSLQKAERYLEEAYRSDPNLLCTHSNLLKVRRLKLDSVA